jgi:tetratricopeptide (TPR) repeat protein
MELSTLQSANLAQALALADQHLQAGRTAAAESLARDILRSNPKCAPALHIVGIAHFRAGNLPSALDFVRRATVADDRVAIFHANLVELLRRTGDRQAALAAGRRALKADSQLPQAHNNIGIVHYELGDYPRAVEHYRKAIKLAPGYVEAFSNLGNALRAQKKYDEALTAFDGALALRADHVDALNNKGTTLRDFGRLKEAEAVYRRALALKPDSPSVLNNLALALKESERYEEASRLLIRSLLVDPNNAQTLTYFALVRLDQKEIVDAELAASRALAVSPDNADALNAMGLVRSEQLDGPAALALLRRAVAIKPDLADAHNNIGSLLKESGELAAAREAYARAVALAPREAAYFLNFADANKFVAADPHLAAMEELAEEPERLSTTRRIHIDFALAKAYDDLGRYDEAFARMRDGGALKRTTITYDEAGTLASFDQIRNNFDRAAVSRPHIGFHSQLPIFIVGMPRSGTTLVEQIIASHPEVHGAGELADFHHIVHNVDPEAAPVDGGAQPVATIPLEEFRSIGKAYVEGLQRRAPAAKRITDKMPANFLFLGAIHMALPDAHIIHVMRDPRDCCLSCFSKLFSAEQNFTYDLGELGRYYRKYAELMAHWRDVLPPGRFLDVRYEDVVDDLEGSARRIVAHCGLEWHASCVAFHQAQRPVRTASATQVRQPIYRTSEGRWRAYERHLGPLLEALGDVVPAGT